MYDSHITTFSTPETEGHRMSDLTPLSVGDTSNSNPTKYKGIFLMNYVRTTQSPPKDNFHYIFNFGIFHFKNVRKKTLKF